MRRRAEDEMARAKSVIIEGVVGQARWRDGGMWRVEAWRAAKRTLQKKRHHISSGQMKISGQSVMSASAGEEANIEVREIRLKISRKRNGMQPKT